MEAGKAELMRSYVGAGVALLMDGHMGNPLGDAWDLATAKAVLHALEPYDLFFFEEPLPYTDPWGYGELNRATTIPIAGGEHAFTLYEIRDLLRRGATEIDAVVNIGKLVSRQFPYLETELVQMASVCHGEGAILKVILENAYLTEELKLIACKIAKRAEVDYVKTSTGFAPSGCTVADVRLMYAKCAPRVKVKAAGGIRTMEAALEIYEAGADRIGA